ncbi:MAG: hopanoid biosynthesis associated protein HpnK [Fibrobacteres bacterium]|nr:hopanoid biosynthesis associated protein HpnK [Fibrobacterota bacterium]
MIPSNLIINADDFGLDERVSGAISQCLDEKLINSFSVFPFRDAFHKELLQSILSRHPGVRVGAHLALVDGTLKEHPGHFRDFLTRYLTGRMPSYQIHDRWKSQIEILAGHLGKARRIAHLDSHQHLHILPGLWPVARSLQHAFRIPRLRVPYESVRRSVTYRFPFGLGMQVLARLRADAESPGFMGFFSSTSFTLRANHAALEQVLLQPHRTFELMVHPALPAEAASRGGGETSGAAVSQVAPSQEAEMAELRLAGEFFDRAACA